MKKSAKRFLFSAYLAVNRRMGPVLERLIAAVALRGHNEAVVPVFIVGAPRAGTTLTFQLIVHCLRVGYLTNMHCMFFGFPSIVSRMMTKNDRAIEFRSNYGRTSGRYGPSECGEWWYRFFPRNPAYVTREDLTKGALASFRRSLTLLAKAEDRPVVFKNLYAGMRIDPIASAFPNAVFIHVQRDTVDNALSILAGRKSATDRYDIWWSVPPPGYKTVQELSPARQVVAQISLIDSCIQNDVRQLGLTDRVLNVKYEEICDAPSDFISLFCEFMKNKGVNLSIAATPPERFPQQSRNEVPKDIFDELLDLAQGEASHDE